MFDFFCFLVVFFDTHKIFNHWLYVLNIKYKYHKSNLLELIVLIKILKVGESKLKDNFLFEILNS